MSIFLLLFFFFNVHKLAGARRCNCQQDHQHSQPGWPLTISKAGVSKKPGRCFIARAARVISDANSFLERRKPYAKWGPGSQFHWKRSPGHKVFISYGLMRFSRRGPSTDLRKMNDSRKLPQQHGSLGSCNNCHCVNSARRSMKRLVEESLSVVSEHGSVS